MNKAHPPSTIQLEASRAAHRLPPLLAEAERLSATLATGVHGRRRAGTGETFWQYRDYTQGDPASMIDWRQSARSPERLYVRETEWETAAAVRFWCSGGPGFDIGSDGCPTKRRRALVIALALGFSLIRAGEAVGPIDPGVPTRTGLASVSRLGETLIDADMDGDLPPVPGRAVHAIFLSDFYLPTEELVARIRELPSAHVQCHFVEVTDPKEDTFPFDGHTIFDDGRRGIPSLRFGQARAIRNAYQERRNAHRAVVKDACRRAGITLIRHVTNEPPSQALSALHYAVGANAA